MLSKLLYFNYTAASSKATSSECSSSSGPGRNKGQHSKAIEKAKEESNKLREKAKMEIEQEKESALHALRSEVVDLTMTATKKLIGDVLDDSKHRGIIENYIQKLPESEKN